MTHVLSISFNGRSLSMNDMGDGDFIALWKKKKSLANFMSRLILVEFGRDVRAAEFGVEIHGNLKSDVDNRMAMVKVFVDCLRKQGIVEDDRPKFFKFCMSVHDDTMPKNESRIDFHFNPKI